MKERHATCPHEHVIIKKNIYARGRYSPAAPLSKESRSLKEWIFQVIEKFRTDSATSKTGCEIASEITEGQGVGKADDGDAPRI